MIGRRQFALTCAGAAVALVGRSQDFSTSVRVVNVFATVRDRDKQLVRGLTRENFTLSEDGRRREVRYFSAQSDLPLTLGLLFDASGSQRTVLDEQRRASDLFTSQLLRRGDWSFEIVFNRQVTMVTDDGLPEASMRGDNSRGTALYDAIVVAAGEAATRLGRKAAVILSDGVDTASITRIEAAIMASQRADLTLYPIRVYDREVFKFDVQSEATDALRRGKSVLERLARETGGSILEGDSLEQNFARIGEELRNQYSLGFTPEAGRAGYRKLRVTVDKRGLSVQARDGYYAGE